LSLEWRKDVKKVRYRQYGAAYVAQKYCGLPLFKELRIRGEWQHGWHPEEHNVHPELVIGNNGLSKTGRSNYYWVARKDQEEYLKSHGYINAQAIGLPIIYVEKPKIRRVEGSLLVMPAHSLPTTTHKWDMQTYAREIGEISSRFSKVVVCVHPSCLKKRYWVDEFEKRGFSVIPGADPYDSNSLSRMAELFCGFKYVTGNTFGSYIVYSAFFGAKPSIYGSYAEYREEEQRNTPLYMNCPELLPIVTNLTNETNIRKTYDWLFSDPDAARSHKGWADYQLGQSNKLEKNALRCVLAPRKWLFTLGCLQDTGHYFTKSALLNHSRAR